MTHWIKCVMRRSDRLDACLERDLGAIGVTGSRALRPVKGLKAKTELAMFRGLRTEHPELCQTIQERHSTRGFGP